MVSIGGESERGQSASGSGGMRLPTTRRRWSDEGEDESSSRGREGAGPWHLAHRRRRGRRAAARPSAGQMHASLDAACKAISAGRYDKASKALVQALGQDQSRDSPYRITESLTAQGWQAVVGAIGVDVAGAVERTKRAAPESAREVTLHVLIERFARAASRGAQLG